MKFLITARMQGKTTRIVEWLNEDPDSRVIVVANEEIAKHMQQRWHLSPSQVLSTRQIEDGALHGRDVEIGIDNVEFLISRVVGYSHPVEFVTATGEIA